MTLVLGADQLAELVGTVDVLGAVEAIFADLGTGSMRQPAPTTLAAAGGGNASGGDAILLPMVARSDRLGLAAVKLMADIPENAGRNLPTQRSTIMVTSVETGECIAVLDGAIITRMRTAAASAVATRHLARPESRVLGLIGAGNLAIEHVRALRATTGIDEIVVWSRSAATIERFRVALDSGLRSMTVAADPRSVVENCDVLCTLTPSVEPIIEGDWLHPGQHVNAVGARPRPTHRELDGAAIARGTLIVDSAATALAKSGDLLQAIADGAVPADASLRELGAVIAGIEPGRVSDDEITVFNSVGLAAQDLAVAAEVIELARHRGCGTEIAISAAPSFGWNRPAVNA
ncbi:ornithine cyclodeaminase family protein [Agreia pratensis]|uniref:Ornithine cyclodeaminase/alanine dehydrogenase n=1 Tax=Agreia pratensis TaxID=150121 RepID=A0A1X7L2J4_9MICO|nr:ornithine cyclodeaminase family protein [Agreia pratensis]SMG47925.1 ornithine cyclodeaminase/alanine dehydrogenase [Agreia pratensis]